MKITEKFIEFMKYFPNAADALQQFTRLQMTPSPE